MNDYQIKKQIDLHREFIESINFWNNLKVDILNHTMPKMLLKEDFTIEYRYSDNVQNLLNKIDEHIESIRKRIQGKINEN